MNATSTVRQWVMQIDRRVYALLVGLVMGVSAGLIGLGMAVLGFLPTLAIIFGLLVGLYVLTDVQIALFGAVCSMLLLPFGTVPFKIAITPTFLDLALGAFLFVYLMQIMTGKRQGFRFAPPQVMITLYAMWLIFAFVLGFQYANPTSTDLRRFAETLLAISLVFLLVDLIRDAQLLRRLLLVVMLCIGAQAVISIALYLLNDVTAETLLVRLSRFGYPNGGVIRYIEDNPDLGERAIGTWVDPNALGGLLAVGAILIAPQLFAQKPILKPRWLAWGVFGVSGIALYLTNSRASFLALALGFVIIVFLRYRRYIPLLMLVGFAFLFLPQTQNYIDRIFQAFRGEDISTQMRIGEWTDAIELIQRYPITGIGFTGTPFRNLYTDVANMYLIMANQIGITGVVLFLVAMASVFNYGYGAWRQSQDDPELEAVQLGLQLALLTALVNAIADLYFFRLDFQSSITWFWFIVALNLACTRLTGLRKPQLQTS